MAAEPQTAFFSYSRDDSEFALRLAEDLKAAGANVWLDQLELVVGKPWDDDIQRALKACPCVVVILSPSCARSPNVLDEVSFALKERKTVIPVLYRDCKFPYRLDIDFTTDYDRGLKTLLRRSGGEPQAGAAGGAAASAVRKDTAADVSDADERERAEEQQRLGQKEKQTAEQARQGKEGRQRTAADGPQNTDLEPAVPEGVYFDPETDLMWTIQDNGEDIDWNQANQYAEQLRLGGYSDWRLPTIDELEKLYDPQSSEKYKIRKPFRLTDHSVWSWTKKGSGSSCRFSFIDGLLSIIYMDSLLRRALCVRRSGK